MKIIALLVLVFFVIAPINASINWLGQADYQQSPLAFRESSILIGGLLEPGDFFSFSGSGGATDFINGAYESSVIIRGSARLTLGRSFLDLSGFVYPNKGLGNQHRLELSSSSLWNGPVFGFFFADYRSVRFNLHKWLVSDFKVGAGPGIYWKGTYASAGLEYYIRGARKELGNKLVDKVFSSDSLGFFVSLDIDPSGLSPSFFKSYLRLFASYNRVKSQSADGKKDKEDLLTIKLSMGESVNLKQAKKKQQSVLNFLKGE